jgi:hypothetical protein
MYPNYMHKGYREKYCHFIYLNMDEVVDKIITDSGDS